jgi:hypothetical protein
MLVDEVFLNQLIANERRAIRDTLLFAGGLVLLGILVIILSPVLLKSFVPETVARLVGIGGAFISSLSAFQIKDILTRRGKVEMLVSLEQRLHAINLTHAPEDESVNKHIDELVWKIVEKTALG